MPEKTSPFIEVKWGWPYGSSGWNSGMDENLVKFSFLFDSNIDGIVSSLPSPVNGKAYYLSTDKRVYYVVDGVYYASPLPLWYVLKNRTNGTNYLYDGSNLVPVASNTQLENSLTNLTQTVSDNLVTSKNYTDGKFSDLLNQDDVSKGAALVGRSVVVVESVSGLSSVVLKTRSVYLVKSFYANGTTGSSLFKYDNTLAKSNHNGGTIISPTVVWDGSYANLTNFLSGVGETNPSGSGCFVRLNLGDVTVDHFGAVPDLTTDTTPILQHMDSVGIYRKVLNSTSGGYLINQYIPTNNQISFSGNAVVKIQSGHQFNVSVCERDIITQDEPMRVIFTDVDWDWGTCAYLKSIGFNTIMTYGLFDQGNQILLLRSVIAAKMSMLGYSNATTASLPQQIDSFKNVVGYYIFDEPDSTGASVAVQDARIDSYKAVTKKPLWCSLVVDSELQNKASVRWDGVLVQLYFADDRTKYSTGNTSRDNISHALDLMASFRYKMPKSKVIPLCGLFTNSAYTLNTSAISSFAQDCVRTGDGEYGCFVWGGQTDPGNLKSPKNDSVLLDAATLLENSCDQKHKIEITSIVFASDNIFPDTSTLDGIINYGRSVSPSSQNLLPMSVKNVGSVVDDYNSNFHEQGLAAKNVGGYYTISVPSVLVSGSVYGRFWYVNKVDTNPATVGIAVTQNGFDHTPIVNQSAVATGSNVRLYASPAIIPANIANYNYSLEFEPLATSDPRPWKFLSGFIYLSNWPEKAYT